MLTISVKDCVEYSSRRRSPSVFRKLIFLFEILKYANQISFLLRISLVVVYAFIEIDLYAKKLYLFIEHTTNRSSFSMFIGRSTDSAEKEILTFTEYMIKGSHAKMHHVFKDQTGKQVKKKMYHSPSPPVLHSTRSDWWTKRTAER